LQSILIQSEISNREALVAELWECGTTGIIESSDTVRAFFENNFPMSNIMSRLSCPVLEVRNETTLTGAPDLPPNRDPIYAGQRFFIVSSYMDDPTPPNRKRLVIDASDAFGSGSHESTQLVIQALEEYLPLNATVLDVGCGSGVLSAVMQELGATLVFACDTHLGALPSARKHSHGSHFFGGSIDALVPALADLAVVNISARAIDQLADELRRVTKPTGLLILAGFTNDRTPARFHPEKSFQLNDWLCWLCRPLNIQPAQSQKALQPFPAQWW
jgi:SAM-dependent methyltransferase